MTCSKRFGRLLQASCLGLIGMLTVVGCGGSDNPAPKKDAGPSTDTGPVTPPVGTVTVDKGFLDFGAIDVGSASTPQTVNVTVKGAAAPVNATVTGAGFAISANTCAAQQPIGACAISVKFAPQAVGGASGVLTVGSNSISLSGSGQPVGQFSATDRVDLGTLLVNATATAVVQIIPNTANGVTGLTCTPSGGDLTLASQTCAATGAITAQCSFTYTFKAATAGVKSDSVVCSGGGKTTQTTVAANVVTPSTLAVNPSSQPFTAIVGQPVTWTFNVSNSGGSPTGTLAATISAGAPDFAIASNDCVVALPALGVCKITVTFTPTAVGAKNGTLTVTDATPGSTPATATLTGTGIQDRLVTITPATSDFGTVKIPAVKTTAFTMANNGGTATDIVALAASDPEFSIGSDLCSGRPLAAKAQCTFSVTFTPAGVNGLRQAMVNATQPSDGAILASAAVSGTVQIADTQPKLVFTPPTLDFGTTGVGVSVGPKTFTVTNTGGTATGALSVVKNDSTSSVGGASQFTYTTTCTAALAPNASCQLVVTFAPTISRSASAVLTVSDNSVASAYGTVTGIALAIPDVTVTCAVTPATASPIVGYDYQLDDTVVGQSSAPVVCTVKNNTGTAGSETPQATGAITPTVTGPFSIGTNNCTASLDPGLSCTLTLLFTPTAKGPVNGMLTVTTANRGADNKSLSGVGLLVVEIVERELTTGTAPSYIVTNYDFGQVSVGATSKTTLTLDVYVRGQVGNLAIDGTDLKWTTPPADTAAADFVQSGGCAKITTSAPPTAKLTPYCTMLVVFNPQSKTAKTNTITAHGANGTASDTATMKGTGSGPITIAPSTLTFDAVAIGSSSVNPMTLTVCNNAPSPASAATFTITGANAADFALVADNVSNKTIPAGPNACVYQLLRLDLAASETPGSRTATVTVTATVAGATESATGTLVGSAVTGAGLTAALGGAFADTAITNVSAPVVVTVTNGGSLATDVLVFEIPATGGDFFLTDQTQADPLNRVPAGTCALAQNTSGLCNAGSTKWCGIKLDPSASCTTSLWFMPSSGLGLVKRATTLTVRSKVGGMQVLDLTANAKSQLTLSPATIDLGPSVIAGAANPVKTITLTNNGGVDISATDILPATFTNGISQTGAAQFLVAGNTCTPTLGKAGSTNPPSFCLLSLQLVPPAGQKPGPRAATLEVLNHATGNGTQKATAVITGTAVTNPDLHFTDASLVDRDFGSVMMGSNSLTQKFTVTNKGGLTSSPLSFDLYDLGANGLLLPPTDTTLPGVKHVKTGDFATAGTTCTGDGATLAPGASCDIVLAFHPTQCPVGSTTGPLCPDTGLTHVQLIVTNVVSGNSAIVAGPKLWGTPTALPTGASLTVAGVSPYDFGAGPVAPATTKTVTITVSNTSATTNFTLATPTFPDAAEAGSLSTVVASAVGEFTAAAAVCPSAVSGGVLAAGLNQSCTVVVTWTPPASPTLGTREVKMTMGAISMSLFGRLLTSANLVAVSNTPLNFGDAVITTASPTLAVTVQNQGELATTTDIAVVAGADTSAVTATGCQGTGSALAPGASCVLVAKVTPAAVGSITAADALDIVLAGHTRADSLLPIGATWNGVNPATLNPTPATTVTFANTAVLATSAGTVFTFANPAASAKTGPLAISVDSDNFVIDLNTTNSTCLDATHAFDGVTAGLSCTVNVMFRPTALATPAKTGNLKVTSTSGASATCPLAGTAIPALTVADTVAGTNNTFTAATGTAIASLTFQSTSITTFKEQVFTITNTATGAGTNGPDTGLLSTSIGGGTGSTPDQFKIVADGCVGVSVLGSGATRTCQLTVRFAPTSAGLAKNAVLTVLDPSSGTPADSVSVNLKGDANQ